MAINWIRGFRRIGLLVTFPAAALIILAFHESTKEFSPLGYEVRRVTRADFYAQTHKDGFPHIKYNCVEIYGLDGEGGAFLEEVPKGVVDKIVKDYDTRMSEEDAAIYALFKRHLSLTASSEEKMYSEPEPPTPKDRRVAPPPGRWNMIMMFTVHKQVNKLRLTGLILGSILISALIIQGSISILAWIFRGFKP